MDTRRDARKLNIETEAGNWLKNERELINIFFSFVVQLNYTQSCLAVYHQQLTIRIHYATKV